MRMYDTDVGNTAVCIGVLVPDALFRVLVVKLRIATRIITILLKQMQDGFFSWLKGAAMNTKENNKVTH
jgi:hypothetical protein